MATPATGFVPQSAQYPPSLSNEGQEQSPGRESKRRKVTRACDNCKARKRRCTGELPCSACHAYGSECTYLASYTRGRIVQPLPANHAVAEGRSADDPAHSSLYPTDNALSLRNGNDSHAHISRATSPEGGSTLAGQYLGPTSPYTFLRRAWKRFDGTDSNFVGSNAPDEPSPSETVFAYGDRHIPPADINAEEFRLPPRPLTSSLVSEYFDLTMPTYRFLHRQTVECWLATFHEIEHLPPDHAKLLSPSRQAVILMVLATARLYNAYSDKTVTAPDEKSWLESEELFQIAKYKLKTEHGKARLELVQARLAICLFLLHTHRPNQAWYFFGTTCQLVMALGLHRATAGSTNQDLITRECRKRAFWAASTLDTYLSVILGRPPLIHLDDVDQMHPDPIDDESLTSGSSTVDEPRRDSIIKASILHGQIVRIVKKVAREQYSVQRASNLQKLEAAARLNAETAAWQSSLPIVLSGAVHPSSLIPIFRRQITILQLAYAHACMLINRPSLLLDTRQIELRDTQVNTCLVAAKSALESLLVAGLGENIFQIFWFMQFVCFNALSIVYVWLIQRKSGRLPSLKAIPEDELLSLARTMHKHLSQANYGNAPSLRYSIVLEELQQEVQRVCAAPAPRPMHLSVILDNTSDPARSILNATSDEGDALVDSVGVPSSNPLIDAFPVDFPLDPDLWLALDSFPFSDFGQLD